MRVAQRLSNFRQAGGVTVQERQALESLLMVIAGDSKTQLERLRHAPISPQPRGWSNRSGGYASCGPSRRR